MSACEIEEPLDKEFLFERARKVVWWAQRLDCISTLHPNTLRMIVIQGGKDDAPAS